MSEEKVLRSDQVDDTLSKGVFLLTLDTELAWGGIHSGAYQERSSLYSETRPLIEKLLALFERFDIHATWAIVGHLFLSGCSLQRGCKHPDIKRPSYSWFRGDWFDADPCSDMETSPHWYAPDIVEKILSCEVRQEIGCHGFSHLMAGDAGCSRECFASDLRAALRVADDWGLELTSFVYPRNSVGHVDVLQEYGFTCYRGVLNPQPSSLWQARKRKAERMLSYFVPVTSATATPRRHGRLWNLPGTQFYPRNLRSSKRTSPAMRARRARLGVDRAARTRTLFHLWLHPFNLARDPDGMLQGLKQVCEHVARRRETGDLTNPTMSVLAAELDRTLELSSSQ